MTESLEDRLDRLERERQEADRRYNDALTELDRALLQDLALPTSPTPYDPSRLPEVNAAWDILPEGPFPTDRTLKGRVRGFVWRLVGPALNAQRHFNALVVEHLNRNVAAHEQAQQAAAQLIGALREHLDALRYRHSLLMQLLQTVTGYVDTKDRSTAGGQAVLNAGLSALAETWLKRWESLGAREERMAQRLASLDDVRQAASLAQQTALSLKREVERLLREGSAVRKGSAVEEVGASVPSGLAAVDLDAFKYLGFEDQFRGSVEDIRRGLAEYLPFFEGTSDILDLGCGRGEFLELLRERGVTAHGLDVNRAMVEASRERGLDVIQADALDHLVQVPDASLGGIFAAQVVEHLQPDYLARLLEVAGQKVRPGGLIVLETINPACWLAFFESYIRDLSHVRPIHPDTLQYLLRVSGFHDVAIRYRSPVAEAERLQSVPAPAGDTPPALADLTDTFNENIARLNARLFTYQDYAVIGRR